MDPIVYIVDDDNSVRTALGRLIKSMDMDVQSFNSAEELLDTSIRQENSCLILDIHMPGMSGIELHRKLKALRYEIPVIFITAFDSGNVRNSVKLAGAADFFVKPVDDNALLEAIKSGLSRQPQERK